MLLYKCCVESISNQSCCPECNRSLSNLDILSLHSQLNIISQNEQFHIMDTLSSSPPPSPSFSGHVMVTMLNGSSFKLAYHPSTSVLDFQKRLENVSGVKVDNQKLVYQNVDLNVSSFLPPSFPILSPFFSFSLFSSFYSLLFFIINDAFYNRLRERSYCENIKLLMEVQCN